MNLVKGPLHGFAIQAAECPRARRTRAAIGQHDVVGDVVPLAVVSLDALDAERQQAAGQLPPPLFGGRVGEVDRGAGPHPPLRDERLARRFADEQSGVGRRRVVGRRLTMQALERRLGWNLAVARVEVDPRSDPHDGAHSVGSQLGDHRLGVRELVGVELPSVVLRRPRGVDDDGIERDLVPAKAMEVVEHIVLVLVDVAALPEAVGPLGLQPGEARAPAEGAQASRRSRLAEELEAKRTRAPARRDRYPFPGQLEPGSVRPGVEEGRVAPARQQPRHRCAVALRNAARGQHLGRAIGTDVSAVGTQLHVAAALVELSAVTRAEADEPLPGATVPVDPEAQRRPVDRELQRNVILVGQIQAQAPVAIAAQPEPQQNAVLGALEQLCPSSTCHQRAFLGGNDALGEVDELIANLALGCPHSPGTDQAPARPANRDRERAQVHVDAYDTALKDDLL